MAKFGLHDIFSNTWFMDRASAEAYFPIVLGMLENPLALKDLSENKDEARALYDVAFQSSLYSISAYGEYSPPEKAPKGSVAVISIDGAMTKKGQFCGDSGTGTKATLLERCYNSSNIDGVVLYITSPGGSVNSIEPLKSAIEAKNKPVVAYVDELAASCGYWVAALTDEVVVKNERVRLGSIGAYVPFANFKKYYEKKGVEVRDIYSSFSDLKNKSYRDALEGKDEALIKEIDAQVNFFFSDVKAARPVLADKPDERIFKGDMFFGDEAVRIGLADHIGGWDTVIARINSLKSQYEKGGLYV